MLPSDFFLNQGYQVFKNAIPNDLVSGYLRNFEIIKHRKTFLYYSQSIHRWIRPRLSRSGYLTDSILNPSLHVKLPGLLNQLKISFIPLLFMMRFVRYQPVLRFYIMAGYGLRSVNRYC